MLMCLACMGIMGAGQIHAAEVIARGSAVHANLTPTRSIAIADHRCEQSCGGATCRLAVSELTCVRVGDLTTVVDAHRRLDSRRALHTRHRMMQQIRRARAMIQQAAPHEAAHITIEMQTKYRPYDLPQQPETRPARNDIAEQPETEIDAT